VKGFSELFSELLTTYYLITNSWIKGTVWGTMGFDPRYFKRVVNSFSHTKMILGTYKSIKKQFLDRYFIICWKYGG